MTVYDASLLLVMFAGLVYTAMAARAAWSDRRWACSSDGSENLCEVARFYLLIEYFRLAMGGIMLAAILLGIARQSMGDKGGVVVEIRSGMFAAAAIINGWMSRLTLKFRARRRSRLIHESLDEAAKRIHEGRR